MSLRILVLSALVTAVPTVLHAQLLPFGVSIDGRVGYVAPVGDFAENDDDFATESGISYAVDWAIYPLPNVGLFAGYHRATFGCEQCLDVGLDDRVDQEGLEAGLHLALPLAGLPLSPWTRLGILYETVAFSGLDDSVSSDAALGFSGAVGIALPVANYFEITPAVRYYSLPADFEFEIVPNRSLDATSFSVDLGISVRI